MPVIRPFARPLLALMLVIPVTACLWDTDEAAVGRQGWSGGQRTAWYWGTQGSRLMPQTWFEALEQPGGAARDPDRRPLALATDATDGSGEFPDGASAAARKPRSLGPTRAPRVTGWPAVIGLRTTVPSNLLMSASTPPST